jgi:hypothetical protein
MTHTTSGDTGQPAHALDTLRMAAQTSDSVDMDTAVAAVEAGPRASAGHTPMRMILDVFERDGFISVGTDPIT